MHAIVPGRSRFPSRIPVWGRAYGLQFHIEPDTNTWTALRDYLPTGLIEETETKRMQVDEAGQKVISRFFDLAFEQCGECQT